jgi:hypothetical protein
MHMLPAPVFFPLFFNGTCQYLLLLCHARYDMLCLEGIARALNIFKGRVEAPRYSLANMKGEHAAAAAAAAAVMQQQ